MEEPWRRALQAQEVASVCEREELDDFEEQTGGPSSCSSETKR